MFYIYEKEIIYFLINLILQLSHKGIYATHFDLTQDPNEYNNDDCHFTLRIKIKPDDISNFNKSSKLQFSLVVSGNEE